MGPGQAETRTNLSKIRSLLIKTLVSVKKEASDSESSHMTPRSRKESTTEPESIEEVLTHMQKGWIMLKHSRNTKKPHNKFVYLSTNHRHLCWKSLEKDDEKTLSIQSIVKIWKRPDKTYLKENSELKSQKAVVVIYTTDRVL